MEGKVDGVMKWTRPSDYGNGVAQLLHLAVPNSYVCQTVTGNYEERTYGVKHPKVSMSV